MPLVYLRRSVRGTVCWLLSVAVLVSGAPRAGFAHRHQGGDRPHSHHGFAAQGVASWGHVHAHGHAHPHCHSHPHHSHDEKETSPAAALIAAGSHHIHLWLLGFQLTLPTDDNPEEQSPSPKVVFLTLPDTGATLNSSSFGPSFVPPFESGLPKGALAEVDHVPRMVRPQVLTAPLCDSARFERSGVQVI